MSELKPCPFCGAMTETDGKLVQCYLMPCAFRRFKMPVEAWNTRPIEDALNKRIAELDAEVTKGHELQDAYCDRIAELEAEAKAVKEHSQWLARLTESSRKENEQIRQTLSVYAAKRRWIHVSERLPETDGQYIGYTNTGFVGTHWLVDGHFVVTYSCEQNWLTTPTSWILESTSGGDVYVTHWMPLPEPPKERE